MQTQLLLFTSRDLQYESYAVNATSKHLVGSVFQKNNFYFLLTESKYSEPTSMVFQKLGFRGTSVAILLNISRFHRTLFFLKKNNFYTIGLVPYSLNP
jgi:hypothetical protein